MRERLTMEGHISCAWAWNKKPRASFVSSWTVEFILQANGETSLQFMRITQKVQIY